jgi:hypothetical protein
MNSSSLLRVQGDLKYTSNQQSPTHKVAILKFLRLVAGDTSLGSEFSQVWVLHKFQLGDELTNYKLWLERIPNLENYLQQVALESQTLISFKSCTYDCGSACLAMVSQYWRKRLSLNTLRNLARVDCMGASVQNLAEAGPNLRI